MFDFQMPKERKKRKQYDERDMEKAIKLVKENKAGFLKAANMCNVPRTTLHRLCQAESPSAATVLGHKPVFTAEQEKMLSSYLLDLEKNFFGMTSRDLRRLAYQLAKSNRVKAPFNSVDEIAGKNVYVMLALSLARIFRKENLCSI